MQVDEARQTLGLASSAPTASEVRIAYRQAALQWHPDRHIGASPDELAAVEAGFKRVGNAYAILQDFLSSRPQADGCTEAQQQQKQKQQEQANERTSRWDKPKKAQQPLPPGWQPFIDRCSGAMYYYNASTRQSQWKLPTAEQMVYEAQREAQRTAQRIYEAQREAQRQQLLLAEARRRREAQQRRAAEAQRQQKRARQWPDGQGLDDLPSLDELVASFSGSAEARTDASTRKKPRQNVFAGAPPFGACCPVCSKSLDFNAMRSHLQSKWDDDHVAYRFSRGGVVAASAIPEAASGEEGVTPTRAAILLGFPMQGAASREEITRAYEKAIASYAQGQHDQDKSVGILKRLKVAYDLLLYLVAHDIGKP